MTPDYSSFSHDVRLVITELTSYHVRPSLDQTASDLRMVEPVSNQPRARQIAKLYFLSENIGSIRDKV